MEPERLHNLEQFAAAASPGPWLSWETRVLTAGGVTVAALLNPDVPAGQRAKDAAFVGAARLGVPELCAALRAERERREQAEAERDRLQKILHLYRKRRAVDGTSGRIWDAVASSFTEDALRDAGEPELEPPPYRTPGDLKDFWQSWLLEGNPG